jgi:type I restriction enzyme M protein
VSKEKIKENDYNLNIPRYVDSYEKPEPWDLHSIMFGGIPNTELNALEDYWKAFPTLREYLCKPISERYVEMAFSDIGQAVRNEASVISYKDSYTAAFADLREKLRAVLIEQYSTISAQVEEEKVTADIFERLESIGVIDKYEAFQVLDNVWNQITADIEIIQTEGEAAIMQVDPHMVTKKKNDKDVEVQEGWEGHILPFELVQEMYLTEELHRLQELQRELAAVSASYSDMIDSLTDEEKEAGILNDAGTEFVSKEVKAKADEALEDIESDEINALLEYLTLPQKKKAEFVKATTAVDWSAMTSNKNGIYTKAVITARLKELKSSWAFPEDSFEAKLLNIVATMEHENALKREIKASSSALHEKTKQLIEGMELEQAKAVLEEKWITPIVSGIMALPENLISNFIARLVALQQKYAVTFANVGERIDATEASVSNYAAKLRGDEYAMAGLEELQKLLGGGD